ncbi:MAG TPA: 1-acyl-sn-glycerol-3-phosphate acyltransferase [Anaerolineales bacterium]|nr:1-acyl-sn-glycerol-3-phosphate acyltransferase [Anaerolineales bacterium]
MSVEVSTLAQLIEDEVILAMSLPVGGWLSRRIRPILACATCGFSEMFVELDRMIEVEGMSAGARWPLLNLAQGLQARGVEHIPSDGPLIIASNHPGTVDSITLAAAARRDDLEIVASSVPFLQNLPHVSKRLIFTARHDLRQRMLVVREAIRHLRSGGSFLIFADGNIDPDPAFMPHAEEGLHPWSRSIEIFPGNVPQTQVITSIVSHVIDPRYRHHPITWLRRVSFGDLLNLQSFENKEDALPTIIESARRLLRTHLEWQI